MKVIFFTPEATFGGTLYHWLKVQNFPFLWYNDLSYDDLVPDILDAETFQDAHVVLFVRNPYDRALTYYHSLRSDSVGDIDQCYQAKRYGFLRYVEKFGVSDLQPLSRFLHPCINHTIAVESFNSDVELLPFDVVPLRETVASLELNNWEFKYDNPKYRGYGMINDVFSDDFINFGYEMRTGR